MGVVGHYQTCFIGWSQGCLRGSAIWMLFYLFQGELQGSGGGSWNQKLLDFQPDSRSLLVPVGLRHCLLPNVWWRAHQSFCVYTYPETQPGKIIFSTSSLFNIFFYPLWPLVVFCSSLHKCIPQLQHICQLCVKICVMVLTRMDYTLILI